MGKSSNGAFALIKGKVGGVVFYKITDSNSKDKQGQRAYVGQVRNPQSERQQYQRAILKTITNIYSAGRVLFNHSFQGKTVGGGNAREFRKLNMNMLRSGIMADIAQSRTGNAALYRVCAPGTNMPVLNPYIISQGSYPQQLFTRFDQQGVGDGFILPTITGESETVGDYMARNNILPGDIYTFVFMFGSTSIIGGSDMADFSSQFATYFHYVRMIVKTPTTAEASAELLNYGQLFDATKDGVTFNMTNFLVVEPLEAAQFMTADELQDANGMAIGMIRSREDQDLRSNTTMEIIMTHDYYGITPERILDVWMPGQQQLGNSELILEGGSGNF